MITALDTVMLSVASKPINLSVVAPLKGTLLEHALA